MTNINNIKQKNIFTNISDRIVKTFIQRETPSITKAPNKNNKTIINNYSVRETENSSFIENLIYKYKKNILKPYMPDISSINNILIKKDNNQCFVLFKTKTIDGIDNENVLHIFSNELNMNFIYNKLSDNDIKDFLILFLQGKNSSTNQFNNLNLEEDKLFLARKQVHT